VITKLTETWKAEQRAFAERDLSDVDYVYLRADGIHVDIRLEEAKLCLLVMIGVRADGRKELVALAALPKSAHPGAKKAPAEIWNAEDKRRALDAVKGLRRRLRREIPEATSTSRLRIVCIS
jgi:hypothetical protein